MAAIAATGEDLIADALDSPDPSSIVVGRANFIRSVDSDSESECSQLSDGEDRVAVCPAPAGSAVGHALTAAIASMPSRDSSSGIDLSYHRSSGATRLRLSDQSPTRPLAVAEGHVVSAADLPQTVQPDDPLTATTLRLARTSPTCTLLLFAAVAVVSSAITLLFPMLLSLASPSDPDGAFAKSGGRSTLASAASREHSASRAYLCLGLLASCLACTLALVSTCLLYTSPSPRD